jgi:hypothetical protein
MKDLIEELGTDRQGLYLGELKAVIRRFQAGCMSKVGEKQS